MTKALPVLVIPDVKELHKILDVDILKTIFLPVISNLH